MKRHRHLYHAPAGCHVPVKFIGIPCVHHTPQDPAHLERAIHCWVVKYLGH